MAEKVKIILLDETKKNMEQDIGLTLKQIDNMDLCEIEKHIASRRKVEPKHVEKIYRKTRGSTYAAMGRFLTAEKHEERFQKLLKRYS